MKEFARLLEEMMVLSFEERREEAPSERSQQPKTFARTC